MFCVFYVQKLQRLREFSLWSAAHTHNTYCCIFHPLHSKDLSCNRKTCHALKQKSVILQFNGYALFTLWPREWIWQVKAMRDWTSQDYSLWANYVLLFVVLVFDVKAIARRYHDHVVAVRCISPAKRDIRLLFFKSLRRLWRLTSMRE